MFDEQELSTEQTAEVETTAPVEEASAAPQPQEDSSEVKNLRAMREKNQRIERERDEAVRMLKEMEYRSKPQEQEEDLDFQIDPDALAEGKHLSKVEKKFRRLENELKQYKQQTSQQVMQAQIKMAYPDFDRVVNNDTIAQFKEAYPELASTIATSTDPYSQAVSAYTLIKKFGISQDEQYAPDRERAQANAKKPKPIASMSPQQGNSPLAQANAFANGLTDDLRKTLHAEMIAAMKNR